ncbi:MAG: DUF1489 domain-containing protein [Pseudomonadota bacterium]
MPLHLLKVAVGAPSADALAARQKAWYVKDSQERTVFRVRTRQTPKRQAELLEGGSLYWIIKGFITARQDIWAFEETIMDGRKYMLIHLNPDIVRTQLTPRGPHQGWRYLKADAAPQDVAAGQSPDALTGVAAMPLSLQRRLRDLALI